MHHFLSLRISTSLLLLALVPVFSIAQVPKADTTDNVEANLEKIDATYPAVYKIDPVRTVVIGAAATAANMIAINNILHNKKDLTPTEVQALRPDIVNPMDRWALELDPTKRDRFYRLSDHSLTVVLAASAASFVLNKRTRKDWLRLGLMYYETQFLTFAFYDFSPIGPFFQNRIRPVSYYDYFPMDLRRRGNQRNSLYSGHVANATSATFFAVKVYCDYHPEIGKKKYLLYGAASLPALFTGWARIKALAHFPSDVLVGYTIGGLFGIMVPQMHKMKSKNIRLSTFYNGQAGGLQVSYRFSVKKPGTLME
jgi:hypothetical protein